MVKGVVSVVSVVSVKRESGEAREEPGLGAVLGVAMAALGEGCEGQDLAPVIPEQVLVQRLSLVKVPYGLLLPLVCSLRQDATFVE